jgi:hypothetical protein
MQMGGRGGRGFPPDIYTCFSAFSFFSSGRKLVVWRYTTGGRAQCRELTLPPSDLAHRSYITLLKNNRRV